MAYNFYYVGLIWFGWLFFCTLSSGLIGRYYNNSMLAMDDLSIAACTRTDFMIPSSPVSIHLNSSNLPCNISDSTFSVRWDGVLIAPSTNTTNKTYELTVTTNAAVRFWLNDWQLIEGWEVSHTIRTLKPRENVTLYPGKNYTIRLEVMFISTKTVSTMGISLFWRSGAIPLIGSSHEAIGARIPLLSETVMPNISEVELYRQTLLKQLARGWNTWYRASATAHTHLPSGVGYDIAFKVGSTQLHGGIVDKCTHEAECVVRPGPHTFNGSFTKITQRAKLEELNINITIFSIHADNNGDQLVLLFHSNVTGTILSKMSIVMRRSYYFDAVGEHEKCSKEKNATNAIICISRPAGLRPITLYSDFIASFDHDITLYFDSSTGMACVTVNAASENISPLQLSLDQCVDMIKTHEEAYYQSLRTKYGTSDRDADKRDSADAIRSVVGWNTMFHQTMKVVTPVSRDFGPQPYAIWLWDTYFLTLLAAESDKKLAYANLIAVTKGRGQLGNIPGIHFPNVISNDRSKPFVGATVLLQHYKRFQDLWIVKLLFEDLLHWNLWAYERRIEGPMGLIGLGSEDVRVSDGHQHTRIAAVWESGLDNSPMYDGVYWDPSDSKLRIYDVGQTSYYLAECQALEELAILLGKTVIAKDIRHRRQQMEALLPFLWDEERRIFANKDSRNNVTTKSLSPTSLYPMMSGAATIPQAISMVNRWLTSMDGFCVRPPSISRSMNSYTLQLYWNPSLHDNAICSTMVNCEGHSHQCLTEEKYSSNINNQPLCAENMKDPIKSGYTYIRNEGIIINTINDHLNFSSRQLHFFYSANNSDNFIGFNATEGPASYGYVDLGPSNITILVTPPNSSIGFWPLDLYWNEQRKDFQNVANPISRKYLSGYKFFQRLGWVQSLGDTCWSVPSVVHSNPAYTDQTYWRGRVWGPMNLLIYFGLNHSAYANISDITKARKNLCMQSRALLLREWRDKGHVHENYNAMTGWGSDVRNSNPFYHWGGLLGLIGLWEDGF